MAFWNNNKMEHKNLVPVKPINPRVWDQLLSWASGLISSQEARSKDYVEEGYLRNPTVRGIIDFVADTSSSVPWGIYKKNPDGTKTPTDNVLLQALLDQPNAFNTWSRFVREAIVFQMLQGNTFIWMLDESSDNSINRGMPTSLWNLPAQNVQIIPSADSRAILGYSLDYYHNGTTASIGVDEVIHVKTINPRYDEDASFLYGVSKLDSAREVLAAANKAIETQSKYLDNQGAKQVLFPKNNQNVNFDEAAAQKLKSKYEDLHVGSSKAGNTLITPMEMDALNLGMTAVDIELLKGYNKSQLDLCSVYKFPPLLIGLQDSTYENQKEASKALWNKVNIPMLNDLRDQINMRLVPAFGSDLCIDYDLSSVSELQENGKELADRLAVLKKAGIMTPNEVRTELGLEPMEGGDDFAPERVTQNLNSDEDGEGRV